MSIYDVPIPNKLNTETATRWVAALRSGNYQQGSCTLRRMVGGESEWCCLGVLCDLLGDEFNYGWEFEMEPADNPRRPLAQWSFTNHPNTSRYVNTPPNVLAHKLYDVPFEPMSPWAPFVRMNDTLGWTFDMIADAIEEAISS